MTLSPGPIAADLRYQASNCPICRARQSLHYILNPLTIIHSQHSQLSCSCRLYRNCQKRNNLTTTKCPIIQRYAPSIDHTPHLPAHPIAILCAGLQSHVPITRTQWIPKTEEEQTR